MAIQDALLEFSVEYTLTCFLGDLSKIQDNTFKKRTIKHVFEKFSMWSIDANKCIKQLKIFAPQKKLHL